MFTSLNSLMGLSGAPVDAEDSRCASMQVLPSSYNREDRTSTSRPSKHSPSYEKFLRARRASTLLNKPENQVQSTSHAKPQSSRDESWLNRLTWTVESKSEDRDPDHITAERVRPVAVDITAPSKDKRKSIAVLEAHHPANFLTAPTYSLPTGSSPTQAPTGLTRSPSAPTKPTRVTYSSLRPFASKNTHFPRSCPNGGAFASDEIEVQLGTVQEDERTEQGEVRESLRRHRTPPPDKPLPAIPPPKAVEVVLAEPRQPLEEIHPAFRLPVVSPPEVTDMGLARSLTKRLQRSDSSSGSLFRGVPERKRPQISAPQLIHTTNQFIHDAAFIRPESTTSRSSTGRSSPSSEPPPLSHSYSSRSSSSDQSTDRSSPQTPKFSGPPNHLAYYFEPKPDYVFTDMAVSPPALVMTNYTEVTPPAPPALPARAATHSKREHVRLARQRSIRTSMGSPAFAALHDMQGSFVSSSSESPAAHPFGAELEQLEKFAEDFNLTRCETLEEEEEVVWLEEGFRKLRHSVYLGDLADLESARWSD